MSDLDKYRAKPNPWFEKTIEYIGEGKAEFSNPKGWIKGETRVSVDEVGNISIRMQIEDYEIENPLNTNYAYHDNLIWLLSGRKPYQQGNWSIHAETLSGSDNPCKLLQVTTADGTFINLDTTYQRYNPSNLDEIEFQVLTAEFQSNRSNEATYWIMPLSNYIHRTLTTIPFPTNRYVLDHHPLRIRSIARVSDDLPRKELQQAIMYANRWNSFIPFKFAGKAGFIESLNDYSEAKEKLTTGSAEILTTAVMIGDCMGKSIAFSDIFDWVPLDFLHMLSLASGSLVGIPWIELRDENGTLVKRIHTRQWQARYTKGHKAIHFSGEISTLLSYAPEEMSSQVRTALRLAVKASSEQCTLNDRMLFLFVAFDTLTQYYRKSHLIDSLPEPRKSLARSILDSYEQSQTVTYDARIKNEVEDILKETMQELRKFGKSVKDNAKSLSDPSEKRRQKKIGNDIIDRVSQVVRQAIQNRRHQPDESEAILLLLKEHGFHDPEVIKNHKSDWKHRVGMYRNQLIHEGFFKTDTGEHRIAEFAPLSSHLLDILLRILLRKLNYEEKYIPAIPLRQRVSLDWIQPDTSWSDLGY